MTPRPAAGAGPAGAPAEAEFAALMAPLGPFETGPHIAVGVSGGADSLALALLLHRWATPRGGRITALTVDHRLRPESAAEARRVSRLLRPLGIAHRTLRSEAPAPAGNLQAEARRLRHRLLEDWCARNAVLHLALAHHLEDQAETLLLRLGRGSGLDGLAAMPAAATRAQVQILRPLLCLSKARLIALLEARRLHWIDDPSNREARHARVRMRALAPALAAEGLSGPRLAATAGHLGRARQALDRALADLLLAAVRIHPAGYAELDSGRLAAAPDELALRGLARLLMSVGGLDYPPRLAHLERLLARLRAGSDTGVGKGLTLGGCRILRRAGRSQPPRLLVVREARRLCALRLAPGSGTLWDGRFKIALGGQGRVQGPMRGRGSPLDLAALGQDGWAELRAGSGRAALSALEAAVPAAARASLPALRDARGLVAVPHLGYRRPDTAESFVLKCRFVPRNGLTAGAFTVA